MPEAPASDVLARSPSARLPGRSRWLLGLFRRYVHWYIPRHFRAVRLSRAGGRPTLPDHAAIVALNHPSWWDPLICLVLSDLFPGRAHHAPIDAVALERYRFFGKLGFFGVERDSLRGARDFLRVGRAILDRPDGLLWITAQGRFVDARDRPTRLEPGLGHLLARADACTVVPLAIELTFWDERLPEALARFGEPIAVGPGLSAADWTDRLARALQATQDALASEARRRDPADFATLLEGEAGVGFVYDAWRRVRSGLRRRPGGRGAI